MSKKRQDEIAAKAVRKSTLKSIAVKKRSRLKNLRANYEQQVREVNIQYAEDPERLKAKYAAEDYAKSERAKKAAERKIAREKKIIELEQLQRKPTMGEEIASSIVQGIGACIFIAALAILDTLALNYLKEYKAVTITMYSLYGASMILMYIFSTLRHALTNYIAKSVFSRLSHVCTFLSIGFAYSAFTITKMDVIFGWILFGIVWALALTGMIFYSITGIKHEKTNIILATVAGFSGIIFGYFLYKELSPLSLKMIIGAAACYIVGVIFYCLKKVKYMHLIANIFILFGSIFTFLALFFIQF